MVFRDHFFQIVLAGIRGRVHRPQAVERQRLDILKSPGGKSLLVLGQSAFQHVFSHYFHKIGHVLHFLARFKLFCLMIPAVYTTKAKNTNRHALFNSFYMETTGKAGPGFAK